MIVRLVLALLMAPWYGMLAVLATIPLMVVMVVLVGVLVSVTPEGRGLDALAAAVVMAIFTGLVAFFMQVMISVQQARYAGAFSGAMPLGSQPPFMKAYWRGFFIILLFAIFTGLLMFSAIAIVRDLWVVWELPRPGSAEIAEWAARLGRYLEEGGRAEGETSTIAWTVFGLRAFGMVYSALLALVMVPRVCGIGSEGGRTWTLGYFLFRIFVAVPCCALMTAILAGGLIMGVEFWTGEWPAPVRFAVAASLEAGFFGGIMFAFEAMLLRAGREVRDEALQALEVIERGDPQDYRALRQQWSDD